MVAAEKTEEAEVGVTIVAGVVDVETVKVSVEDVETFKANVGAEITKTAVTGVVGVEVDHQVLVRVPKWLFVGRQQAVVLVGSTLVLRHRRTHGLPLLRMLSSPLPEMSCSMVFLVVEVMARRAEPLCYGPITSTYKLALEAV